MSHDAIQELLARLPADQRASAEKRIAQAEIAGYVGIGLWEWIKTQPSSEWDLVGEDAQGRLRFLA